MKFDQTLCGLAVVLVAIFGTSKTNCRLSVQVFLMLAVTIWGSGSINAAPIISLTHQQALSICTESMLDEGTPLLPEQSCKPIDFAQVNPQGEQITIKIEFDINTQELPFAKPYGLYLLAKASSRIFLNGNLLGENGVPSKRLAGEEVGKMDASFYIPENILIDGKNSLVIHMSSHNGYIDLQHPVHFIGMSTFSEPNIFLQQKNQIALVLMGALLLGGLYLGALSTNVAQRNTALPLSLMAFIAAAQLFAEASRGLINYDYPVHDIRLVAILLLAFSFGALLLHFISKKFGGHNRWHWFYAGIIANVCIIFIPSGFDAKTTLVIFIPCLLSVVIIALSLRKKNTTSTWLYLCVFALIAVTILITATVFHELILYIIITTLICFLFVQQARDYAREQELRKAEEKEVAKLSFKLAQQKQQTIPQTMTLNSAGKIEKFSTADISFCKAAGDYVELYLNDNQQKLFSGTMKKLESLLPKTFIRVHRSFLVNLDKVIKLTRDSGGGNLILDSGEKVPVSRRLLPEVRSAINSDVVGDELVDNVEND